MKLEQFAYRIAAETLAQLEKKYHYRISEEHKKDVQSIVCAHLSQILAEMQQKKG